MKVLVISGCNPHSIRAFEAANTVLYHVLDELARMPETDVSFLRVGQTSIEWPDSAIQQKHSLSELGVKFAPDLVIEPRSERPNIFARFVKISLADPEHLCPGAEHSTLLKDHISHLDIDIVLTVWSEFATAMASALQLPHYAYYGNPDPKVAEANWYRRWKLSEANSFVNLLRSWKELFIIKRFESAHKKVMRSLSGMGNVADNDVGYYDRVGEYKPTYVPNMWAVDKELSSILEQKRLLTRAAPIKIAGNIGQLITTGNSLGLLALGRDILPELERCFGEIEFEVHLYGAGMPHPDVLKYLQSPRLKFRGFVDDINAEIMSTHVFLVANNWDPRFQVGNTRFLHACSLASCCVSFCGSARAMPELIHNQNVLLGATPEEVASLIYKAAMDSDLRERLGSAGYNTVKSEFDPKSVVSQIRHGMLESLSKV